MGKLAPHAEAKLRLGESRFALAMSLMFALSVLAVFTGVAAIVGAFLAGLALAESSGQRERDLATGVSELLVPFFLAGIGLHVNLAALSTSSTLLLATVVLAAAIVSKFIGCGLGALSLGKADALRIGVGMIPRGEVGMVVAQLGLSFGIIEQGVYSVVVFMSVATTIVAPPLLKIAYRTLLTKQVMESEEAFRIV
jgi:Kef-type K+ transport system membrane component KefB